ncbi:serine threonine-protein kinase, partial [Pichia californica]
MSLVRYNTADSLEPIESNDLDNVNYNNNNNNNNNNINNNNLAVVYKNNISNEVVLYDPNSKGLRIVQLKNWINPYSDLKRKKNSRRNSINHLNSINDNNNNNIKKFSNYSRRKSNSNNSKVFVCSVCGAFNHIHNNDDDDDNNNNSNNSSDSNIESDNNNSDKDIFNALNNFFGSNNNSNYNFIRGDYFKLLTNSMNVNNQSEALLTDGNNFNSDLDSNLDYKFQTIPENLINQGYFNKFFKILSKLGSGSFGSVYKVEHDLLGLNLGIFALKKIPIGDDINNLKKILSEVKFLYDLSCNFNDNNINNNNVVKYNHVWVEIDQISIFSPKIPVVFLLFEYCDGGTLEEWVNNITNPKSTILEKKLWKKLKLNKNKNKNKNNDIDENEIIKSRYLNNLEIFKIFNDITQGLNYLHNLNILHRDLKPSNCLFKNKFDNNYNKNPIKNLKHLNKIPTLLVSDFGESIMVNSIDDENWQNNIETTGNTGTLEFVAPEIILQRRKNLNLNSKFGGFSYASDIYSLGMILYYLCFGKLPFSNSKFDPDEISKEILDFKLFNNLNKIRPIINIENNDNEFENDGLLIDWIELINKMVSKIPDDRPKTSEILNKLMLIYDKLNKMGSNQMQLINTIEDDNEINDENDDNNDTNNFEKFIVVKN